MVQINKIIFQIAFVFFLFLQLSCGSRSDAKNYKDAYILSIKDSLFIKLKGERVPLHNPGTYEDSILIPIPKSEGRIEGKDVPVREGYYKYQGYILINGNKLTVDLLLDNYDDKRLDHLSWNGEYNLIRE